MEEKLMNADVYFAEHIARDRLAEARARAEFAALLRDPTEGARRASGSGTGCSSSVDHL